MASSSNPLSNAIAFAEGFGKPGAVPTTSNNPGDLKLGDLGSGTMPGGITIFPTPQAGWTALDKQVQLMTGGGSQVYTPDQTISQAGQTYSGGDPAWAANVGKYLGVDPNSTSLQGANGVSQNFPIPQSLPGGPDALGAAAATGNIDAAGPVSVPGGIGTDPNAPVPGASSTLSVGRIASGIIGIVCIGIGLLMFKQTQSIIIGTGKTIAKGAALAA